MALKDGKILVVDDDPDILKSARIFLSRKNLEVITEGNPKMIPTIIKNEDIDVVLLDMNFKSGESDGLEARGDHFRGQG